MRNSGVKLKIFTRIVGSILGGALAFPRQRIVFYIPVALLAACVCSFYLGCLLASVVDPASEVRVIVIRSSRVLRGRYRQP